MQEGRAAGSSPAAAGRVDYRGRNGLSNLEILAPRQRLGNCAAELGVFRRHVARKKRDNAALLVDDVLAEVPRWQVPRAAEERVDRRLRGTLLRDNLLEHR